MQGIEGKIAIVTGGAQGIGAATCRKFIAAGARVVIGDINGDRAMQLADELGSHAAGFQFDAADTDQVKELVEFTVAKFGGVDFLFNNAAIMSADQLKGDTSHVNPKFGSLFFGRSV